MHFPIVLLMLSCSLSLCGAAKIVEDDGLPVMWSHTISQAAEFGKVDETLLPDPWHFLERMSLYHVLIASTDQYMASMGPGEKQSPLWGLPLQLAWMFSSGRLEDPTPASQCGHMVDGDRGNCISTNSWYSCVNYYSSVLPFLSAAKQGLVAQGFTVQMKSVPGVDGYCTTYEECKTAFDSVMTKWDHFFTSLRDSVNVQMEENVKKDTLLGLYWTANMASTYASAACDTLFPLYSAEEKVFAENWRNLAEFVAAVHFQSNLNMSTVFMTPLPGRVLKENDAAPNIADLTAEENHALSVFSWMKSADTFLSLLPGVTFTSLAEVWRSAMCSVEARETGRDMLKSLVTDKEYNVATFADLAYKMSSCPSSS